MKRTTPGMDLVFVDSRAEAVVNSDAHCLSLIKVRLVAVEGRAVCRRNSVLNECRRSRIGINPLVILDVRPVVRQQ